MPSDGQYDGMDGRTKSIVTNACLFLYIRMYRLIYTSVWPYTNVCGGFHVRSCVQV